MIKCQFSKTYTTQQRTFFLDIDASFKTDTFNVLFGPSGAGKTSLLRTLSGLDAIDKGSIRFKDQFWVDTNAKVQVPSCKRIIAFVFQDHALFPNMTVLQNLQFAKKKLSKKVLDELVSVLELNDFLNSKPNQLSGGQKQRVALARAILQEPDLLLLDEPFTALDQQLRDKVQSYVMRLPQQLKCTIIMVSHNLQEVLKMADSVCVLENGKVVQQGNPSLLIPKNPHNTLQGTVLEIKEDSVRVLIGNQQVKVANKQIVTTTYTVGAIIAIDLS